MSREIWSQVDRYLDEKLVGHDEALEYALQASTRAGLPAISVTPTQGKLLYLLARVSHARRILEIGTLGGYSTIWLARAVAGGGRVVSLEIDAKHAEVARANIARAGLAEAVEVRLGAALDSLARLAAEQAGPFDLFFIDADKASIPAYFDWALQLARPGSLIIVDNVIRHGAVIDARSTDPDVRGIRAFNERLAAEPRVSASAIQTVGAKGHDGWAVVLVN